MGVLLNGLLYNNFDVTYPYAYVLKKIEDAKVDQHEGSVMVGEILKKLYKISLNLQNSFFYANY